MKKKNPSPFQPYPMKAKLLIRGERYEVTTPANEFIIAMWDGIVFDITKATGIIPGAFRLVADDQPDTTQNIQGALDLYQVETACLESIGKCVTCPHYKADSRDLCKASHKVQELRNRIKGKKV